MVINKKYAGFLASHKLLHQKSLLCQIEVYSCFESSVKTVVLIYSVLMPI